MPLSSIHYPPPTLSSPTPAGTVIIETAWCTPGLLAYSVSLKRKRSRKRSRRRVRVPVREPMRVRLPVRVRGYHPFFEDFVNRLPYREALPGRDFIVALEAGLFAQQVAEGQRALELSRKRLFRVDPRGIPFIQVQPVLIGGAIVAGVVGAAILAVLLAPAIGALIPVMVEAAAATSTAIAEIAATAATWTEVKITAAAAAGIVTYLVTGGMGKAEAEEAVKPLVGKRIVAMADITGIAEWTNPKPGQEVKIGGQTFNAIMLLTTR
ncbi:MAG TPA: hypothetical protein VHP14_05640 [Anaerolineales bacterium]|nr:hypothetical protein [Anaerolineales bacterium]